MARSLLCPDAFLSPLEIDAAVSRALAEDLGRAGDITATATIPEDTPARAIVVARAAGVISGLPLVAAAFAKLEAGLWKHFTMATEPSLEWAGSFWLSSMGISHFLRIILASASNGSRQTPS